MLLGVVVADDVHLVQAELDLDALVGRGEETQGVEGELELGADADEDAAFGLDAVLPAELQRQDVLVLVRLWECGWRRQTENRSFKLLGIGFSSGVARI